MYQTLKREGILDEMNACSDCKVNTIYYVHDNSDDLFIVFHVVD